MQKDEPLAFCTFPAACCFNGSDLNSLARLPIICICIYLYLKMRNHDRLNFLTCEDVVNLNIRGLKWRFDAHLIKIAWDCCECPHLRLPFSVLNPFLIPVCSLYLWFHFPFSCHDFFAQGVYASSWFQAAFALVYFLGCLASCWLVCTVVSLLCYYQDIIFSLYSCFYWSLALIFLI